MTIIEGQQDPRAYVGILWRWRFLFLAILVLVPIAVYVVTSREQNMYQSNALVNIQPGAVDTSLFATSSAATPTQSLDAIARVITTPAVARIAANRLTPPPSSVGTLLSQVTATADNTTGFITITAQDRSPDRAADIANAFAAAIAANRTAVAKKLLDLTIANVRQQLLTLPKGYPDRQQLQQQLAILQAERASQGANSQVIQGATPSSSPSSPRIARATLLGVLVGLLLGLGAVLVAEAADRRLRRPDELEQLTGLPLLAVIPRAAFSGTPHLAVEEAFQMLRSAITYFNVDKPLSSVLISSPMKGDGKTTVATMLSLALARAGRSVILLDADLRRPAAAARLGVEAADSGLAQVLTGQAALGEVLVEFPLGDQAGPGRLRILHAGPPPPNPSELIASDRMRELLAGLERQADIVVVDTNPLLSVSDSLPLLDAVSGIVVIGRLGGTTKDAVRRLQRTIVNAHGTMLGVVATNSAPGIYGRYSYGYGYGSRDGYDRNGKKKSGDLASANGRGATSAESTVTGDGFVALANRRTPAPQPTNVVTQSAAAQRELPPDSSGVERPADPAQKASLPNGAPAPNPSAGVAAQSTEVGKPMGDKVIQWPPR